MAQWTTVVKFITLSDLCTGEAIGREMTCFRPSLSCSRTVFCGNACSARFSAILNNFRIIIIILAIHTPKANELGLQL